MACRQHQRATPTTRRPLLRHSHNGVLKLVALLLAIGTAVRPTSAAECKTGDVDLSSLPRMEFNRMLSNGTHADEAVWIVGWCSRIESAPIDGYSPCTKEGGYGFVQQFALMECSADFDTDFTIQPAWNQYTGVVLTSWTQGPWVHRAMNVEVKCDLNMADTDRPQMDGPVRYETVSRSWESVRRLNYTMRFRSRCACANACGPTVRRPTATPVPVIPPEPYHPCVVGANKRDLSSLPPFQIDLPQHFQNNVDRYTWVVGWCSRLVSAPAGYDPCLASGAAGFLQQYRDQAGDLDITPECRADFNLFRQVREIDGTEHPGGGVEVVVREETPIYNKTAHIRVLCDPQGTAGHAKSLMSEVPITQESTGELRYTLQFSSLCACEGKCEPGKQPARNQPPPPSPPPFSCKVGKRDLTNLKPIRFPSFEEFPGQAAAEYWYTVGFCQAPVEDPVFEVTPCTAQTGPGYLQEFRGGECNADFTRLDGMEEKGDSVLFRYSGVRTNELNLAVALQAEVFVRCGHEDIEKQYATPEQSDAVYITRVNDRAIKYTVFLQSNCACEGEGMCSASVHDPTPEGVSYQWSFFVLVGVVGALVVYIFAGAAMNYARGIRGQRAFNHILCICRVPAILKGYGNMPENGGGVEMEDRNNIPGIEMEGDIEADLEHVRGARIGAPTTRHHGIHPRALEDEDD